jgi:hypothetical protein
MLGGVASMLSVVQDELIKDVEHFSEVGHAKFMHTVPYWYKLVTLCLNSYRY